MLDALLSVPVLVKVLVALSLILLVSRFCKNLLVPISVATLVLAFWSGHSVSATASIAWERFWSINNLCLMCVVFQVIWLSSQMASTGVMRDLVDAVRARVSQRMSMAVLPAVIGLLPMPGGALFSAPLVDSCDVNGDVSPALKARTNHWFRHVWEYWWPLYPGVLLAMDITRLDVWQFSALQIPLTVGAVIAGWFFLLRKLPSTAREATGDAAGPPPLFRLVLPIVVVVTVYAAVRLGDAAVRGVWQDLPRLNRYLPMILGLVGATLVLQRQRPLPWKEWRGILFSRRAGSLAAIVAMVRIYGAFIEARLPNGELLVDQMRLEMTDWGIPLIGIVMVLPLVSGLATGLSIGFVGASFPIVVNLLGPSPELGTFLSTIVLAFGFGYMGMLISPVHVCLIVGCEHFKTPLLHSVAALAKPAVFVLIWTLLLHFAVGAVFS
jgi:hypothetical protein